MAKLEAVYPAQLHISKLVDALVNELQPSERGGVSRVKSPLPAVLRNISERRPHRNTSSTCKASIRPAGTTQTENYPFVRRIRAR